MSEPTKTADTIAEALAVSIRVFQEVIQAVGPETAIGFATPPGVARRKVEAVAEAVGYPL